MVVIQATRTIDAAPELIFDAVSNIEKLPQGNPDVLRVEFLTERRAGVGTRFRETRRMGKSKELCTELEVTEYRHGERVRMVADTHGTVWDTLFTIEPAGAGSVLTISMEARAHKLLKRVMNRAFAGLYRRGIEGHLDQVKRRCESEAAGRGVA